MGGRVPGLSVRFLPFLAVVWAIPAIAGFNLYDCLVVIRQSLGLDPRPVRISSETDTTARVETRNGVPVLALASGYAFPVQSTHEGNLLTPAYVVARVPFDRLRFDQDRQHMNLTYVEHILKNPVKMKRLAKFGVYEEKDKGILHGEGLYRIQDGHHRTLALAIYDSFIKRGNTEKLSPSDPKFYEALAEWGKRAVLEPLDKSFVPSGEATVPARERARRLAAIHANILKMLGEAEIPITLYPDTNQNITIAGRNRAGDTRMPALLLRPDVESGNIPIQPLEGRLYGKPFDEWLLAYEARFPSLAAPK